MSISVRAISSKSDVKRFIRLTSDLYKDDPAFIQPLDLMQQEDLDPKKNPFFDYAKVKLFLAERDGMVVGRISATYDPSAQEKWGPNLGYFGYFEADSQDVADALIEAATGFLKEFGVTRMQGPWSLSPKQECGLLIDGFEYPNVVMTPHAKPAYQGWIEANGFEKAHDLIHYELSIIEQFDERTMRMVASARKNKRLTLRELDPKNFYRDIDIIIDIIEDAWENNWGFTAFTKAEGKHLADSLKLIIKPYRTVITEFDGEPVGFMVTMPDLNTDIKGYDGKLFPFNVFDFLAKRVLRDRYVRTRVPLMGVKQAIQKKPIGALAALWMISYSRDEVVKHGAEWGELGWILDDNKGMRSILTGIGCKEYKTYRIFERKI